MNPLSVSLFITRVRCSIPICVAQSRVGERPRPASFKGLCMYALSGKVGKKAYGLSHCFVEYAFYGCVLSFIEHPKVYGVVFGFR